MVSSIRNTSKENNLNKMSDTQLQWKLKKIHFCSALSAGAAEYTNCISAEW